MYDHTCIIGALARREIQSRFGQNALGYAWTYVAPLLWIGGTYFFFTYMGRKSPVYTDLITFIISGLIPFLAFRLVIGSMGRVNGSVRGLVIFPTVTRDHAAVAMALVELVNTFIVFAVVAAINLALFGNGELDNALKFAAGVTLAWGLGAAYGYLFSQLGLIDVTFQHVSGPLLRPAIFLSGIFFVANELPENVLAIFALNPICMPWNSLATACCSTISHGLRTRFTCYSGLRECSPRRWPSGSYGGSDDVGLRRLHALLSFLRCSEGRAP